MSQPDSHGELPLSEASPANVPVFACHVFVTCGEGAVTARVANLAGIELTAANERMALAKIVATFKQQVAARLEQGQPIPWLDPIADIRPGEQPRLIAVHL